VLTSTLKFLLSIFLNSSGEKEIGEVIMSIEVPSGVVLVEGERPYWYGRRSFKSVLGSIILGLILLFLGLPMLAGEESIAALGFILTIIAVILLLRAILAVVGSEYFISSHRMYVKYGVISRRVFEIRNEWITSVEIRQGLMGRVLNYGDALISVPGHYLGTVAMFGVSDPLHVKAMMDDVLRRFREAQKIREELRVLEREYTYGRIPKEKYEELRRKYEEELRKLF
jgi:uncharacterized membrane protein YdbT with pleckstrin-like domain